MLSARGMRWRGEMNTTRIVIRQYTPRFAAAMPCLFHMILLLYQEYIAIKRLLRLP